jgi:hypothetical protein
MDEVFVITRNQRRFEAKNYLTFEEANTTAKKVIQCLNLYSKGDKIKIIKTKFPHKIR